MRKLVKSLLILSLLVVFPLAVASFNGQATDNNNTLALKCEQLATEQEKLKESLYGNVEVANELQPNFYESSYAKATEAQKQELDIFLNKENVKLSMKIGEWLRSVMIITGDLAKDTPRLSLSQARDLYNDIKWKESSLDLDEWEAALAEKFNQIAGAPDFVGGSGINRYTYYLNDEGTEAVIILSGDVLYSVMDESGNEKLIFLSDVS